LLEIDVMEKRATFSAAWIGFGFVLPQILLVFIFFYWPSGAALFWAFTLERPWGGGNEWVGFDNFRQVFADHAYWASIVRSLFFALATTLLSMGSGLLLAWAFARFLCGPMRLLRPLRLWPFGLSLRPMPAFFRC
jgi:sn-glycerol 3-phosphate transport system permease protein